MNTNKGIILLSGGLDSFVCLDMALKKMEINLALTFNYGQKAFNGEIEAVKKITSFYNIKYKIIELPFLKELSNNALTNENNNNFNDLKDVWIPNRNGLFLNIAASFCDKYNYDYIIIGANKEEGRDFPDNTGGFIKVSDKFFEFSTLTKPRVYAPCINLNKKEIVNYLIDNNLPVQYIKSCYKADGNKKHCNDCMSCKLLYNAVKESKKPELLGELF